MIKAYDSEDSKKTIVEIVGKGINIVEELCAIFTSILEDDCEGGLMAIELALEVAKDKVKKG